VRIRAADVHGVEHAGLADVGRVAGTPGDLEVALNPVLRLGERLDN
jgi:hypothetical protein